ncbi:MAG: CPBP family intramembrane metalloprotease [Anaerolineales bacterium]|nr:CPBP family intramembrane metalloprotease [Anaerolineales bacterium]
MTRQKIPAAFSLPAILMMLTFATPMVLWLADRLTAPLQYGELAGSISIILCVCMWYRRTKPFSLRPSIPSWKISLLILGVIIPVLLVLNILNQPVSKITGQARSPFDVLNTNVFLPIAEELIFRGVIWSILERIFRKIRRSNAVLAGTSLLFGVGHLGYWAQTHWPLPFDAVIHALSMVAAGVCFGLLRQKSESLAIPTAVHILANAAILLTQ